MNKRRKEKVIEKPYKKKLIKRRKPNRSIVGDFPTVSGLPCYIKSLLKTT